MRKDYKTFDGTIFHLHSKHWSKEDAKREAQRLRKRKLVRVTKVPTGRGVMVAYWAVWIY